jgi:hypothetical protein
MISALTTPGPGCNRELKQQIKRSWDLLVCKSISAQGKDSTAWERVLQGQSIRQRDLPPRFFGIRLFIRVDIQPEVLMV